ncbi:unnamed protein product [Rhizoctonia solani]|uniref:G domain-containing protein n=1 Tax=Rhizoctonia solani TaxID=456999 RepID=A0A8H3HZU2_9AGAM|nr:unnamed protein product [Rhizoctonia solani]
MPGEYQGNNPQPVPGRSQNDGWKPPAASMLVMGLSGCGKSNFINLATGQTDCMVSTGPKLCTKYARTCRHSISINGSEFRFIDTPGFANDTIDDRKVLERLVEYFAPRDTSCFPKRVTGLLYIHSEDELFKGRTSRKTIEMLVKILGKRFLDRVTVLVRSQNGTQSALSTVKSADSPLYPLYCHDTKPWDTIPYTEDPQSIKEMLAPYIPVSPRLIRLAALENFAQRDGSNWQYNDISRQLWDWFPDEIGNSLITVDQAVIQTRLHEKQDELEKPRVLPAQKEQELKEFQSALENEVKNIREKIVAEKFDHEVRLESLCEAIRDQGDKMSELQSKARNLLAQKERELKDLQSAHEIEMKNVQEKIVAEKSDHEVQFGSLCKTIRDHEGKISELESANRSGAEEIESLKALGLKKDMEIKALQEKLLVKDAELTKIKEASERAIRELMGISRTEENEGTELKSGANCTTNKLANKQKEEVHRLEAEIRRINAEYGSLRSHMQLQENTEQEDIMTALGDLNRLIEEYGQTISEHIEQHMEDNPPKKVLKPQDLLSIFGQVKRKVASKVKQDVYVLFEYAVQAIICGQLYTHLFEPFHPSIADHNSFVMEVYNRLSHQAPQFVSGRWRRDTFNYMSGVSTSKGQDKLNGERMYALIIGALGTLLGKIDGIKPEDVLQEHDKALVKLITMAEEFNRLIKGGVSALGDFQPIAFPFGQEFQPSHMSEVNSKPKKLVHPDIILATVGLGLVKRQALGGDQKPEEMVLRNAIVFGSPK